MDALEDEPYDINFCLPIRELENDRVKLTPFVVSPCLLPLELQAVL